MANTPIANQIYAKTLLDMGVSIRKVSSKTEMSTKTIQVIKKRQDYSPVMLEEFKKRLPYKSYKWADDVLDIITVDEVAKAPLGTKVMLYGVAIDKARDMEGSNRPVFNIVGVVNDATRMLSRLDSQLSSIERSTATT